jgi:hypothetical protein
MRTDLLDTSVNDRMEPEKPSLYHIIQNKQRREQWDINQVTDHMSVLHRTPHEITQVFVQHYTSLFASRRVEEASIKVILCEDPTRPKEDVDIDLRRGITIEEIKAALSIGGKNRAPGPDGICWEFYTQYWEIINPELCEVINQMFRQGLVTPNQTHREMVCIPIYAEARRMEAFRLITLLNTDYKLLARIMAVPLNKE